MKTLGKVSRETKGLYLILPGTTQNPDSVHQLCSQTQAFVGQPQDPTDCGNGS